jgi:hypothetical protein
MLSQTYSIDYGFPIPKTLEHGDKTSFDIVIICGDNAVDRVTNIDEISDLTYHLGF